MKTCPVCNGAIDDAAASCPSCGFRFQETTEAFRAVPSFDTAADDTPHATAASTASLTVLYGKQKGIVYRLEGERALIGRSPNCAIFLNDMTVSRDHALLERVGGSWTIKDDASFNGVWVNNKSIDHVALRDGDVIQIGCFVLRFAE